MRRRPKIMTIFLGKYLLRTWLEFVAVDSGVVDPLYQLVSRLTGAPGLDSHTVSAK